MTSGPVPDLPQPGDAPPAPPRHRHGRCSRALGHSFLIGLLLVLVAGRLAAQERELTWSGEIRVRGEFRDNADFDPDLPDRQRFYGQRTRLGVDVRVNPKVNGRVLMQDSRIWGTNGLTTATGSGGESLDLLEGWLELRWIWDLPLDLRFGRQQLSYGRERLVGAHDWSNQGRTFDAYKLHFGLGAFFLDIFSAKLAETNGPWGSGRSSGRSDEDRHLSGAYFSKEGDRLEQLDLYWLRLFDKTNPTLGEDKRHTFGLLGRYALSRALGIELEYAYQGGEAARGLDIGAQMLAGQLDWRSSGNRGVEAAVGYDWATGDPDGSANGNLRTFQQLFPTGHKFLGNMDYVGRQNVQDAWISLHGRLLRSLGGRFTGHYLRLDAPQDAWYAADGRVFRSSSLSRRVFAADGNRTERELGIELDLIFDFDFAEDSTIQFGYSHFLPGAVVRETGGPDVASDFAFVTVAIEL